MNRQHWNDPVTLAHASGGQRTVDNTEAAARMLVEEWIGQRGDRYFRAKRVCREALDGWQSAEEAREAFRAAAVEEEVL